jgi:hypothetical protein
MQSRWWRILADALSPRSSSDTPEQESREQEISKQKLQERDALLTDLERDIEPLRRVRALMLEVDLDRLRRPRLDDEEGVGC